MRFKHAPKPAEGETRVVNKFLFLPLRLKDETRWLEKTTVVQRGVYYIGDDKVVWKNVKFYDCYDCLNCDFRKCCYRKENRYE